MASRFSDCSPHLHTPRCEGLWTCACSCWPETLGVLLIYTGRICRESAKPVGNSSLISKNTTYTYVHQAVCAMSTSRTLNTNSYVKWSFCVLNEAGDHWTQEQKRTVKNHSGYTGISGLCLSPHVGVPCPWRWTWKVTRKVESLSANDRRLLLRTF